MKMLNPFEVYFSGLHLIEASAGTGKTYNISSLYIRAIIEANRSVDEILVVTYTEAATKELRDRLMRRLRESIQVLEGKPVAAGDSFLIKLRQNVVNKPQAISRLQNAIHSFDESAVYTIHGFCRHALQEHAFNSGSPFEVELIGDDTEIIGEIVDDYWRNWIQEASQSALKRPLLKLLLDKGYSPNTLTNELAGFAGKPYLEISPESVGYEQQEQKLEKLSKIFNELKQAWQTSRMEIFQRLDAGHLRYYRTDWLQGWMQQMDEWLQPEVAPIEYFDKFSRFSQSHINQSLKKASENKGVAPPRHPFFKFVDSYIDLAQNLQDYDVAFKRKLFGHILLEIDSKKEEQQVFSFDDLLIRLRNALCHPERGASLQQELRQAYPIALVDEFQDTDPIQYQIFRSVYAGCDQAALFMIGDPKQSIYSFRGADIFSYLRAKEDAPSGKTFGLGQNYRSVPPLIDGVNALFQRHDNPFILENISFDPVSAGMDTEERLTTDDCEAIPIELRQLSFESDEEQINKGEARERSARDTASEIHKLLLKASKDNAMIGDSPLQAKEIAVLVRSHYQATVVSEALREQGIKSVTHSRESVFHSDEARELYLILKAVVEPADERLVTTALSSSILGYSANELLALKEDETAWAAKLQQFSRWHGMWQEHGFAYMFRKLMQEENVAAMVIELPQGERILTNLIHLSELIMKEEKEKQSGMHSLMKWLLKKRNEDDKDVEEEQLRLESDENLVSVVTMHHSKGLEYPVVFCPYLWDAPQNSDDGRPIVYHNPDNKPKVYLDLQGKNDPDRSEKRFLKAKEELAESVRLAYVAITRAKYKCVINWVHAKNTAHSALGFLLLGSEPSLNSLKASVDSEYEYDGDDLSLYKTAFNQLQAHNSIACPVISDINYATGTITDSNKRIELEAMTFHRALPLPKGHDMSSFSSLIRHDQDDLDLDNRSYYDEPPGRAGQIEEREENMFSFPKGPDPGTAVHHIFENIDFTNAENWGEVIHRQLMHQSIDPKWAAVARTMVRQTVQKSLLDSQEDLKLRNIAPVDMIAELEFYFPTGNMQLNEIMEIIRPDEPSVASLDGFAGEGFLKGFIDLTFYYGGRYYILDYKSNYLGNALEDYGREELSEEIKEAMYDLQYHLYLVALHRYLGRRLADYCYEEQVGGAFYLFLRGINERGSEGIFYDRPDAERIHQLDKYLRRDR